MILVGPEISVHTTMQNKNHMCSEREREREKERTNGFEARMPPGSHYILDNSGSAWRIGSGGAAEI